MKRLAILLVALGAAGVWAQPWQELGPAPITNGNYTGRVSAVACSPTNPGRYFVAGADGGLWRTDDAGVTWRPLLDHMPNSAVGAVALDPSDENVIYVGTGEGNYANHSRYGLGIYKSEDGGNTWTHLAHDVFAGRCFSRIIVHPANPGLLYASVVRAGGFPALAAAKLHPSRSGPVGVFRSMDGGITWTQLTNGLPSQAATDLAMDPANPSILYAAIGHIFGASENGIYKSTNGGNSWTKLGGGLPSSQVGRISIAVAPSRPERLYALITRQADASGGGASTLGSYRSDNSGTTWSAINAGSIQATYGWFLSVVSVQPTNPDVVFMGGLDLVRSTNAGSSFSNVTPPHVDMHALGWDAQGRLVCGNDGGVHRTSNLGGSWSAMNTGLGIIQFYAGMSTHPTNPDILFGGLQDNGSNKRLTNTKNWTQVLGGDGGWTQLDRNNPNRVFVEYQGTGNLFRATDGGSNFSYAGNGINSGDRNCFLPSYEIDPTNSNRLLYGTHRVYESTNGGTNWTPVSADVTNGSGAIRCLAIAPSNSMTVYVATNDGAFSVSFDGGRNFIRRLSNVPGWPRVTREVVVDPRDDRTVYLAGAVFGQTKVRRSRDGGATWEALDGDLPDIPVNTLGVDVRWSPPVLYAGTDSGVYRSVTDGRTWTRHGSGFPNACVVDLRVEASRNVLYAATQGRGAWRIELLRPPQAVDEFIRRDR